MCRTRTHAGLTEAFVGRKPEDRGRMTMAHPVLEADVLQLAAGRQSG